ncbi:MAG: hypothetical protein IPK10_04815 [Bacteroidetes bacterium]|nr:hypothetical protein [Bacteroidota bacterium]
MDLAHLHLLLNHFPVVGTIIGTVFMLYALIKKIKIIQRTVLVLWIVLAAMTPIVMNTGEAAEHKVEEMAGMNHDIIHEHEEAAEYAFWLMIGLGVISLAALSLYKMGSDITMATKISFIISLFVATAMFRTGYLGGLIRHTDLQNVNAKTTQDLHLGESSDEELH